MDGRTIRVYDENARSFADRYDAVTSPLSKYFRVAFPEGGRVLDIGAGSGRDLGALVAEGFDAYGIEPANALRQLAIERRPELASRLRAGSLPENLPIEGELDGVTCSAVLQHVPRPKLFDAVFGIKRLLRDHGRALVAIPETSGIEVDEDHRVEDERLFTGITSDELSLLFERIGFKTIGRWTSADALGRAGRRWVTLLFELRSSVDRPLDRVEGVLSGRERKVATYKFALLRALADIAMTEAHTVAWRLDGQVAVPIERIAQRWVLYYWPLFRTTRFLPQMNGEWGAQEHKLGFTKELMALIGQYERRGGFDAYALELRHQELGAAARTHEALIKKLNQVIKDGPVTYAGGALASGRMFGFERGHVLVKADLWRELSLMGHWVSDALLLRWAQLISQLSQGEVTPEQIIGQLLVVPSTERETADARALYDSLSDLRCTWTDAKLSKKSYHADHVIPFSLWHNNDIWNLLPVSRRANLAKSDKLPSRALLLQRKEHILHYWNEGRARFPKRFEREAAAQTGEAHPKLATLFDSLVESVEVTSLQRACARWSP